jgi:hypothetical protein
MWSWMLQLLLLAALPLNYAFLAAPASCVSRARSYQPTVAVARATGNAAAVSTAQEEVAAQQWDLELFSPAKLNLFLRIIEKRPDNYHELASLFQVSTRSTQYNSW